MYVSKIVEDGVTTTTKVGGELPKGGTGWLIQESNKEDLKEDLDEDMCDVSSWESDYKGFSSCRPLASPFFFCIVSPLWWG